MNFKEQNWIKQVLGHFDFYLIENKLYMEIHYFEGVGLVFRPFENVVGKDHFDIRQQRDDTSEIECLGAGINITKLPRNIESIKNHAFSLYNV